MELRPTPPSPLGSGWWSAPSLRRLGSFSAPATSLRGGPPFRLRASLRGPGPPCWFSCACGRPIWRNKTTHPFWCMCMYSEETYSQIQEHMHILRSAYVHVCSCKIHSDTFRYAHDNMCISECILTQNTIRYEQICTSKWVHISRYVDSKYIQIHADMHFFLGAYLTVSCCMNTALSKHTYSYAQDTAHRKPNTYRYMNIHADRYMCISDMHCAYVICTWMYVVHIHCYMCMYWFYIHTT